MFEDLSYSQENEWLELTPEADDDIETLAFAFETTPESIAALNEGVNLSQLQPEQVIRIPQPPRRCPDGTLYRVERGDTIQSIARRFGVTVAAIYRENPFLLVIGVRPGLQICIPTMQPTRCPGGFFYTIVAGDTLFGIAVRFNTSVNAILQANPGIDPNRLFVGQRICIPTVPPPQCPGFYYTVVSGDTLNSIAFRFNTNVAAILQVNPGLNPNFIVIGQRICIPGTQPQPPRCPGFEYTIVAGDTLFALAARFNTTVDAILRVNPGLDPNRLFIGQQICIPQTTPF